MDLSNVQSSTADELQSPASHEHLGLLRSVDNTDLDEKKVTFMTLPVEIRLRIYDELLVSRADDNTLSWVLGDANVKLIHLQRSPIPPSKSMEINILRTCRQVNNEATPILYSQNAFKFSEPAAMSQFTTQIGIWNVKCLRILHIWVPRHAEIGPWLKVLNSLGEEAAELRTMQLAWELPWDLERGTREGLGNNVDFVRAMGRIKSLRKLGIKGFYGKHWPKYLEDMIGIPVQARYGRYVESKPGGLNELEAKDDNLVREVNKKELELFKRYQVGTEDIFP